VATNPGPVHSDRRLTVELIYKEGKPVKLTKMTRVVVLSRFISVTYTATVFLLSSSNHMKVENTII
jgi:hypothetical protein